MDTDRDLPFLDITAPGFSTRSTEVLDARQASWCVRTPYGVAVLRHREAGMLLRDRRLRQGSHNWPDTQGLGGAFAEFWKRSIISLEGPEHRALRLVARAALSDDWVLTKRPDFREVAEGLADALAGRDEVEFIADFTEPFAGRAITRILGLPDDMSAAVGHDASRLGLAMGIGSKRHEPVFNAATDRLMALARRLVDDPAPDSFPDRLVQAFRAAKIDDEQALLDLIVIAIFGGVDTTRAQLGFAAALFADHPDQWRALRADQSLIPQTIDEVIRTRPTTTWATRQALEDIDLSGVTIRAGEVVHIFVHATARDPLIDDGGGFDITRPRKIHFGFGGGAHHCLGQFVARTDMGEALTVLCKRWRAIEWAGDPEWLPDSGNTSAARLPLRPVRS